MTETASSPETQPAFSGLRLDFSVESLSAEEQIAVQAWFRAFRTFKGVELASFARFQLAFDPGAWKRLQRHIAALNADVPTDGLPLIAGVLLWIHTYTAMGKGKEALYECIAARALGALRSEVLEAVAMAWLLGGPAGLNPLARTGHEFFAEWTDHEGGPISWPNGWSADQDFFRSGIDLDTDDLSAAEAETLAAWHLKVSGEVPAYLTVLARSTPRALKTQRVRLERAYSGLLPVQLVTLFPVHHAAVNLHERAIRRASRVAVSAGVTGDQLLQCFFWAAVYGGETVMEAAYAATEELELSWK